jgi:hypothetical protein
MGRFRFALAVLGTSLALVVAIGVIGIVTAPRALALAGVGAFGGPFGGGPFGGGPFGGGPFGDHMLPPELQGMQNLTPAERFGHFGGAQVNLTDKDGKPFVVTITPGKVTAASANSLTLAANDGTSKTYTIDATSVIRGKPDLSTPGNSPAPASLKQGDLVVVMAKAGELTARFVVDGGTEGFGPRPGGPFGAFHGQ